MKTAFLVFSFVPQHLVLHCTPSRLSQPQYSLILIPNGGVRNLVLPALPERGSIIVYGLESLIDLLLIKRNGLSAGK